MKAYPLALRSCRVGFCSIILLILCVFSCKKHESSLSDKQKSDILSVHFELPQQTYRLGSVRFRELLSRAVAERGTSRQQEVMEAVNLCKDQFEDGHKNLAMANTAKLLSKLVNEEADAVDSLLKTEALYILSRTFFYGKTYSFEPANGLIFQAMEISGRLVQSEDSLVQQVALFQLAREHDVWEGLTKRYGQFVGPLSKEECLYAASFALKIKGECLGLEGPPMMRSLGNLFAGYTELSTLGIPFPKAEMENALTKGIEAVENLEQTDAREYAELGVYLLSIHLNHSINEGQEQASSKSLTKWIQIITGDDSYILGDSITQILGDEGRSHFVTGVVSHLNQFIDRFQRFDLNHTRNTILKLVQESIKNKYLSGDLMGQRFQKVTDAFRNRTFVLEKELTFPITGQKAFELFQTTAPRYFIQEKELLLDQRIASQDREFSAALDSIYVLQDTLRLVEMALVNHPQSTDYWTCYSINQQLLSLKKKVNSRRQSQLFSFETPTLQEIQSSLDQNELWITIMSDIHGTFITTCNRDDFVLDSIPIYSGNIMNIKKPSVLKNQLLNKIATGEKWLPEDQIAFQQLAEYCFKGRIPLNTEHIIISNGNIRYEKEFIWALLLEEYMRSDDRYALKSIRHENKLLDNAKRSEALQPESVKVIAIAPGFPKKEITLDEDEKLALMRKVGQSDPAIYRHNFMPLTYNIDEVNEIGKLVEGILLTGDNSSELSFRNQDFENSVIHIASHAISNEEEVYRSGIVLNGSDWGNGNGADDNILHLHEIRKLDLDAELVVLSACETGVGPKRIRGIQWNLSNAFFEAGCKNIISTTWKVEDKSTHDIMIEFYMQLLAGKGKAEALYAAREKFREANPELGPHYWAPLSLYGDNLPVSLIPKS